MSSHNKSELILIYTKDCLNTEGYKNQMNFVAQKIAASGFWCINRTLILYQLLSVNAGCKPEKKKLLLPAIGN